MYPRIISLHHAESEGFHLLSTMIKLRLLSPDRDMWSLFLPTIHKPSTASVRFLLVFLQHCDLPERFTPKSLTVSLDPQEKTDKYPLRKQLIEWLVPMKEVDLDLEGQSRSVSSEKVDPNLVAQALVVLTMREINPRHFVDEPSRDVEPSFEDLYLMTSFDKAEALKPVKKTKDDKADVTVIPQLQVLVMDAVEQDAKEYMDTLDIEEGMLEHLLDLVRLSSEVMQAFAKYQVMSVTEIGKSPLCKIYKNLLAKFSTRFADFIKKDSSPKLTNLLTSLQDLFDWSRNINETTSPANSVLLTQQITNVIRSLVPSRLMETLMHFALDKIKSQKSFTKDHPANPRTAARKPSTVDDFDADFDLGGASNMECDLDDLDTTNVDSQDSSQGSARGHNKGSEPLFSRELLSSHEQARLLVVSALCRYCEFNSGDNVNNNNNNNNNMAAGPRPALAPQVDPQMISKKLVDLLDPDLHGWDERNPLHLQLLKQLVVGLCSLYRSVSDDEMLCMQDCITPVCRVHKRDQSVCAEVLQMLSVMTPHLRGNQGGHTVSADLREARDMAMKLHGAFWKMLQDNHLIQSPRKACADCLRVLIENDPDASWTSLPVTDADGNKAKDSVRFLYPELLEDRSQAVRLNVARNIHCLFLKMSDSKHQPLSRSDQDTAFDTTYIVLHRMADIEGRFSPDEQNDEISNRTSSLLHTLSNVARSSPVCERKAVLAVCQMATERHLELSLVLKVLSQIARYHGYPGARPYMESHIAYLLHHWQDTDYKVTDFPYTLVGAKTRKEFYQSHLLTIVPLLIMSKDQDSLDALETSLGMDIVAMVTAAIPQTLIHILPLFAASKASQSDSASQRAVVKKVTRANAAYEFMEKIVKKEIIERAIVTHLESIIVQMLLTLWDPASENGSGDGDPKGSLLETCPEPSPPWYALGTVRASLDYLTKGLGGQEPSLVTYLAKSQDSIQQILLSLSVRLSACRRAAEKYRVLYMYRLFVQLLLAEFSGELGGSWAFVLQDLVYTLLHVVQSVHNDALKEEAFEKAVVCFTLRLLFDVVRVAVECCAEELGRFLSVIVSSLVPLAATEGDICDQSFAVIHFLVVDSHRELKASITQLNPLPHLPKFEVANKIWRKLKYGEGKLTLQQEINHFLQSSEQKNPRSSLCKQQQILKFFHHCLVNEKSSLQVMLKDEQSSDFLSSNAESPLVLFLYQLLMLTKSADPEEAELATKCLGEFGPLNLPVIAVKEQQGSAALKVALDVYKEESKLQQYCWVFHTLSDYLVDPDMDTVVASGKVLKHVLSTKTGISFYTKYKGRVGDHLFQYLHPFKSTKKAASTSGTSLPSDAEFRQRIDIDVLWLPPHSDHDQWLRHLVFSLIDVGAVTDEILRFTAPICKVKVEFCHLIFPFIILDMLTHGPDVFYDVLAKQFNRFFKVHCQAEKTGQAVRQDGISRNHNSVKAMLGVVLYLRKQEKPSTGRRASTAWDNNFWLSLDYLPIAQAAHNCGSHFTALLLAEIWCDVQRETLSRQKQKSQSQSSSRSTQSSQGLGAEGGSQLEALSATPEAGGLCVQDLMLEAYRCVGEADAMYGCGAGRLSDAKSRIKTYELESSWYKALGSYDLELSGRTGDSGTQLGLLQALQQCGCSHVLDTYLRGLCPAGMTSTSAAVTDLQYEAAWRNTNWELDTPARLDTGLSFNQMLYTGMASLRDGDIRMAAEAIRLARSQCVSAVSLASQECVRNIYPALSQLHCLAQMDDVLHVINGSDVSLDKLLKKWHSQDALLDNDFATVEPILSQRCVLLQVIQDAAPSNQRSNQEIMAGQRSLWEELGRRAREAGQMQMAERAIHKLRDLTTLDLPGVGGHDPAGGGGWSWRVEEAWVFWSRGECDTAKHLMKALIGRLEKLQEDSLEAAMLYPKCLGIYGNWLAETRSENPGVVMENYLKKATDLLEMQGSEDEAALDGFVSLGRYADAQYQHIVDYMKSSTYEAKQSLVRKARGDADELKRMGDKTSRYLRILEKQCVIDEQELVSLEEDRGRFLDSALRYYLRCLQCGDKHDLRLFRLTSLWFDNAGHRDVNKQLKNGLPRIPSHKFLSLMYQLAARMSTKASQSEDLFQPTLDQLIERCVLDHPHHTLPIILALANATKDLEMIQQRSSKKASGRLGRGSQATQEETEEDRVQAAKAMVGRLLGSERADILQDTDLLSLAYIQMANYNVDKYKKETCAINIPSALQITKLKNLTNVAVPTLETKVDPTCEYKDIVHVVTFQTTFKLAGGINLPKIISCVGSDGVARRQLVKGKDDLRQDAVMQQVFAMVNNLLVKDPEARKCRLNIRRYKVIPLSQRSGLLEWCEGTVPMGDYLIAPGRGAHEKYRPQDLRAKDCRGALNEAVGPPSVKEATYLKICVRFQPVFRHFFMENFPDPGDWYERRLAYTHSVATNSIVGYILGLGDRHVQNILIDTRTAEMVHIDLGVAFEQGRILPTPETVPFRLTRDVVDGMGVAGVEGVFRRCCERTMEVMRASHEALLTILAVLLYDPLYAWTLSPEKALMLQHRRDQDAANTTGVTDTAANTTTGDILDMDDGKREPSEPVNRVAERVLLRLQQKLQGVEDGVPLSVSGQVNLLIQQARDPKNLCRLFPGWQPYI